MAPTDVSAQLNDPWAVDVLRAGHYPVEISEILATMGEIGARRGYRRTTFLIAEGGKLRGTPPSFQKDFRFITHWSADDRPNLFLGTPPSGDRSTFLEVIAWDSQKGAFNYYERDTVGQKHVWIWRGDSGHAFDQRTRGQGCFACHVGGTLVMKELDRPWNNWHSEETTIDGFPLDFGAPARVQNNTLERLIRRGIQLTAAKRVDAAKGSLAELLDPLLVTRAANLVSSFVRSDFVGSQSQEAMPFPAEFFLNAKAFQRLNVAIASFQTGVPRAQYQAAIARLRFTLKRDDSEFQQPGDTFFGALVPAMAAEDLAHLSVLVDRNLLPPELLAALLMVDFPNPVFSEKRASLARHLDSLTTDAAATLLPRLMAIVEQAAGNQPACAIAALDACSGEQQFLHYARIAATAGWQDAFSRLLNDYTAAVGRRLANDADVGDDYVGLLAWRRQLFKQFSIAESQLLFPRQPTMPRHSMTRDGKVVVESQ